MKAGENRHQIVFGDHEDALPPVPHGRKGTFFVDPPLVSVPIGRFGLDMAPGGGINPIRRYDRPAFPLPLVEKQPAKFGHVVRPEPHPAEADIDTLGGGLPDHIGDTKGREEILPGIGQTPHAGGFLDNRR